MPLDQAERERAVDVYRRLLEAWNRRSAEDFAALFTEDGNTVGFDGSPLDGKAAIAASLKEIFSSHPTAAYVAKIRDVRRVGADVILLRAVAGMVPPGQSDLNPATNAIQSLVMMSNSAELKIALLQNTPAAFHGRPQLAEQLTDELRDVVRAGQLVRL